jgi:hypothetical protein
MTLHRNIIKNFFVFKKKILKSQFDYSRLLLKQVMIVPDGLQIIVLTQAPLFHRGRAVLRQDLRIDHHQYLEEKTPPSIIQINANLLGSDGNYELSGATLCYLLATAVDQRNEDLGD